MTCNSQVNTLLCILFSLIGTGKKLQAKEIKAQRQPAPKAEPSRRKSATTLMGELVPEDPDILQFICHFGDPAYDMPVHPTLAEASASDTFDATWLCISIHM